MSGKNLPVLLRNLKLFVQRSSTLKQKYW